VAEQYDPDLLAKLCDAASKETDTTKLLDLTRRITELLDSKKKTPYSDTRSQKAG
jgi:hypothetical protein